MLEAIYKSLNASQLKELKKFAGKVTKFGLNFAVCSSEGEFLLVSEGSRFESRCDLLLKWSEAALEANAGRTNPGRGSVVDRFEDDKGMVLAAVLCAGENIYATAMIDLGPEIAGHSGYKDGDFLFCDVLKEMLGFLAEHFKTVTKAHDQTDMVSEELSLTYEELVLLHKLGTNMKVTETDCNYLQMACDSLTDIVTVEGIAILLERVVEGEKSLVITAGSGLIDINEQTAAILHSRLVEVINNGKEALLDSDVDSPLRYGWPENIRNIIAVPLFGSGKTGTELGDVVHGGNVVLGLMVAINRIDKPDFDSTDVKLFNSVANGCAVFVENGQLFKDIKELFIGSLKALTNSIDAKDPYTRGHSDRVAYISRWIAERLCERGEMNQDQVHKVYLAGLLHDIGKMGIDEAVLRKDGYLTDGEFDHIKSHPSIGAGILSEIRQMHDIVPGILCHHERVDGKGYPSGLRGDQIPLIGKIVGLADSFDAMTSKRVYRNAMSLNHTLGEIEKNLGAQFDEKIGRVFLESDIYRLWDTIQNGFAEMYGMHSFSDYGTAAVGTLVK